MKRIIKILLSLSLTTVFMLNIGIVPVQAANAKSSKPIYLALGDSISYGYQPGTSHSTQLTDDCFVNLLADEKGYTVINHAVSGNEANGILEQLNSGVLDATIKNASIITITCGGNDLMEVLYAKTAENYNKDNSEAIEASDVPTIISNSEDKRRTIVIGCLLKSLSGISETSEFTTAVSTFITNINSVTSYIKSKNSTIPIYLSTQYNPYEHFEGVSEFVGTEMGKCTSYLQEQIKNNATDGQYIVADVCAKFSGKTAEYCFASIDDQQFDFHPNVSGHAAIAECFSDAISAHEEESTSSVTSPVNEPKNINQTNSNTQTENLTTDKSQIINNQTTDQKLAENSSKLANDDLKASTSSYSNAKIQSPNSTEANVKPEYIDNNFSANSNSKANNSNASNSLSKHDNNAQITTVLSSVSQQIDMQNSTFQCSADDCTSFNKAFNIQNLIIVALTTIAFATLFFALISHLRKIK